MTAWDSYLHDVYQIIPHHSQEIVGRLYWMYWTAPFKGKIWYGAKHNRLDYDPNHGVRLGDGAIHMYKNLGYFVRRQTEPHFVLGDDDHLWTEVIHKNNEEGDGSGGWYYILPGTGMWMSAKSKLLDTTCVNFPPSTGHTSVTSKCEAGNVTNMSILRGVHPGSNMTMIRWSPKLWHEWEMGSPREYIDLWEHGAKAGQYGSCGAGQEYRAGLDATSPCKCNASLNTLNCKSLQHVHDQANRTFYAVKNISFYCQGESNPRIARSLHAFATDHMPDCGVRYVYLP